MIKALFRNHLPKISTGGLNLRRRPTGSAAGPAVDPLSASRGLPMEGKTCLITGATRGHGRACALGLSALGAEILPLGRNPKRLEALGRDLKAHTGRPPLEPVVCDLSSLREVDEAASRLLERAPTLDVLINNAGLVRRQRELTVDGYETTMAVNYLAHFHLTRRILPLLKHRHPARILNVSSDTHRMVTLPIHDLNAEGGYSWLLAYSHSKLALVYFTLELHRRLEGTLVSANALDPGPVESGIGQDNPGLTAAVLPWIMKAFFPTAAQAARTAIYVAASPELQVGERGRGLSGRYFRSMALKEPRIDRVDTSISRRLWGLSEQLVDAALRAHPSRPSPH